MRWRSDRQIRIRTLLRDRKTVLAMAAFFVALRGLYGLAWTLAGVTKETEKHWFSQPGSFLRHYLLEALEKPNVPEPYRQFLESFALEHVLLLNYTIPIAQVIAGVFIAFGLFTFPMLLVCLFMHVNFILSGNMNDISLLLYTTAFLLILGRDKTLVASADALLRQTRQPQHHPPRLIAVRAMVPKVRR